ncbi:MAG: hypothetical protein LBQ59_05510 [Candidatus Peribacteria bacterium]|nr:hypothetical protein [Candidatus Peribacteria bacterium]
MARKPKCQECPFKSKCDYFKKSENLENL